MLQRLISYWVYGAALAAILLLALSPLLLAGRPPSLVAAFLLLPAYMLHQYEEHDGDRFRLFFNATIGQGVEVLSPLAVFVTNIPGVWGVIVLSLHAAASVGLGWALVAVYLVLVNALTHIVHGLLFRRYNPGLATAVFLFLPLGGVTMHLIDASAGDAAAFHGLGLLVAIGIHAAILLHVRRRLRRVRAHERQGRAGH